MIGVGGEPERDLLGNLQQAQIGEAGGKREGELLSGRAARIVDDPRVSDRERPGETAAAEAPGGVWERGRLVRPRASARAPSQRIETEGDVDTGNLAAGAFNQRGEGFGLRDVRDVEAEALAGVESHVGEGAMQARGIGARQTVAIGAGSPGEHDRNAVGAGVNSSAACAAKSSGLG